MAMWEDYAFGKMAFVSLSSSLTLIEWFWCKCHNSRFELRLVGWNRSLFLSCSPLDSIPNSHDTWRDQLPGGDKTSKSANTHGKHPSKMKSTFITIGEWSGCASSKVLFKIGSIVPWFDEKWLIEHGANCWIERKSWWGHIQSSRSNELRLKSQYIDTRLLVETFESRLSHRIERYTASHEAWNLIRFEWHWKLGIFKNFFWKFRI